MRRVLVILATGAALLTGAAPASADHGLGKWERCERNAYAQLNYLDPASIDHFIDVSVTCTLVLKGELTDPARIEQLRYCLYMELRHTVKDPVGWGPLFLTSEGWRCVFQGYLGRDVKVPPDPESAAAASPVRKSSGRRSGRRARGHARARS